MPDLQFRDWITFGATTLRSDALNFFEDASKSKKVALVVDCPATFSGYLLNGRVYPGQHMQEGVRTWCDQEHGGVGQFNKPVLLHHDTYRDPIGRVIQASFTALESGDRFYEDWQDPARGDDDGSGRTDLKLRITDEDAIKKFLKGEYLTFSTSFHTPQAICTVCGTNVMRDGWCEHTPGQFYHIEDEKDQIECYYVTGQMFYKEVSVVNDPAQPKAVVKNMSMADCLTSGRDFQSLVAPTVTPTFCLQDATGAVTPMTLKQGDPDVIPNGDTSIKRRVQVSIPGVRQLTPSDVAQVESSFTITDGSNSAGLSTETITHWTASDSTSDSVLLGDEGFALAHIGAGLLSKGLLYTDEDFTAEQLLAADIDLSFDDLLQVIDRFTDAIDAGAFWDEMAADKKLSATERKTLKSNSYCGPGRSFPVPDCAHVTAARRLIGRFKGSADAKKRILASVSSKAEQLGCGGSDTGKLSTETTEMTTQNGDTSGAGGAPASNPDDASLKVLADQIATLSQEKKELQSDRDRVQQELTDMTETAKQAKADGHALRSQNLALMRAITKHADAKDMDTFEKIERYGETIAERSADSIADAIKDEGNAFADALKTRVELIPGVSTKILDATTPDPRAQTRNQEDLETKPEVKDTPKADPADLM